MKAFIDTSILLDWMLQDRPFNEGSKAILSAAKNNMFTLVVSTQSIIDAQYASAYNSVCDFFITRDKKNMGLNEKFNPMIVISPEEFVTQMMT